MGARNAIQAYATYGGRLGDRALRALVYMALVAMDGDAEPWYGEGAEALSEMAFSRKVPSPDSDREGHEAALRAVGRVVAELKQAGAVRLVERPRYGAHRATAARYRLYLDGPCPDKYVKVPHGNTTPPRRWPSDRNSPKASDNGRVVDNRGARVAPSDTRSPKPSDNGRAAFGQNLTGLRTDFDRPSDTDCPTKEYEEYEEQEISSSVAAGTTEGAPELRMIKGRGKRARVNPGTPAQGALLPHGLPSPADARPAGRHADPVVTAVVTAVREVTGQELAAADARRVAGDILGGRDVAERARAAYVRTAILSEPDPVARFLPLPADAQVQLTTCPTHRQDHPAGSECPLCAADRKAATG